MSFKKLTTTKPDKDQPGEFGNCRLFEFSGMYWRTSCMMG